MATSHEKIVGVENDKVKITRALISVSDKSQLVEFAKFLTSYKVSILSTGGTATALRDAGIPVEDVSTITKFPEILSGRVKTLHPMVHGALLAVRGNSKHEQELKEHNILPIDMVVVNLYPFQATVDKGSDFDTCIENIDIGGPSMLRSAAKNHKSITVVSDPKQYEWVMQDMAAHEGATTHQLRRKLAAASFAHTAAYDTSISGWFGRQVL